MKLIVSRLIAQFQRDRQFGECDVKFFKGVKLGGRDCSCIEITHPTPRDEFQFHVARVYLDNKLPLLVRYEARRWPQSTGETPPLEEAYSFLHMQLNVGPARRRIHAAVRRVWIQQIANRVPADDGLTARAEVRF